VVTDQFAAAPIVQELARRGVRCVVVPWTAVGKAEAYGGFKAALNTARLRLVNDPRLLSELGGLEATPTAAGFSVEGDRDDLAAAAVLACWHLGSLKEPRPFEVLVGGSRLLTPDYGGLGVPLGPLSGEAMADPSWR
jgi:hypothetical protein